MGSVIDSGRIAFYIKKITTVSLKKDFQNALKVDPKYFTPTETEKLCKYFKIRLPMLAAKKPTKKKNAKKRLK